MNKRAAMIFGILFLAIFSGFASASVNLANFSINTGYAQGQIITGWMNLSINNEPINSTIFSTIDGSTYNQNASLQGIIAGQGNFKYQCIPSTCAYNYAANQPGTTSKFFLANGTSKTIGLLVTGGTVSGLDSFSLNVTSDSTELDSPQLSITFLNESSPAWASYKGSGTFAGEHYGCYNSASVQSYQIRTTPYCETISIPITPRVIVGAYVSGSGSSNLNLSIYDAANLAHTGNCQMSISSAGRINCTALDFSSGSGMNFSVAKQGNFYICINDPSNIGNYWINGTQSTSSCGFTGTPTNQLGTGDFQVFAQWEKFAPVGSFILNDTSIANAGHPGYSVRSNMLSYLSNNYNNNCTVGCVLPITFTSGQDQNITLSNLGADVVVSGFSYSLSNIYNVTQTSALMSTNGYQYLILNNSNFTAIGSFGNHSLSLIFNNGTNQYNLLTAKFSILEIPIISSINPQITAALKPTNFTVSVTVPGASNINITKYTWNFGDGSGTQVTTSNTTSHTYNNVGVFNLSISAMNSAGLNSSAAFQITVLAPKDAVNQLLTQDLANLQAVQNQLSNLSSFEKESLEQILNLNQTAVLLGNLSYANQSATSDDQYVNILQQLFSITLPQSIQKTQSADSIQFIPSGDNINLDALKAAGGGSYDASRQSDYTDSIVSWDLSNINININYGEFSEVAGNQSLPILDVVKVNVGANPSGGNAYLMIPSLDNIMLDKSYNQAGGYYYVTLGNTPQTVQFATTQSLSPVNLPIFVAPSLDQITLQQNAPTTSNNKTTILIIMFASILVVGIIAYIAIGKWYQNRYESYLFKDRNDLYNIINYIHASKAKGMKDSDIARNLRKSKWSQEQISYVMKRYGGKGVGVPGFKREK
ncbi:MAG: PKD domain-containing protein [Candidatus Pacearchaeota archaeon]|nr:PKD domain-containing protein [Candidatus Pacearchaeota archaeon]